MKLDFINNNLHRIAGIDDALLAAGVSALAAGGQMYANSKMNKRAVKFNREMYDKQRADSISNFDRVNAYNTPEQQMRRFREAGLNPHLMYANGGATSNAQPISNAQAQVPQQETPNVLAMAAGPVNTYMETRTFKAQQKIMAAQELKILADVNKTNLSAENQATLNTYQGSLLQQELVGKKIANVSAEINLDQSQQQFKAQMEKMDTETRKLFQEITNETQRHAYDLLQRSKNLSKTVQEIINLQKDGVIKDLEKQLKNGEITKQYYEKETNKIDQMMKYAQSKAITDSKSFDNPEEALKYIQTIFSFGTSLIK